jgi:general L-amino acid transport system permease protein
MTSATANGYVRAKPAISGFLLLFLALLLLAIVVGTIVNVIAIRDRSAPLPLAVLNLVVVVWMGYTFVLGTTKDPRFPVNARDILIVTIVQLIVFFESYLNILSIAVNIIWLFYLHRSERVRAVYGPGVVAPSAAPGLFDRVRAKLLSSPLNVVLTVLAVDLLVLTVPPMLHWGVADAVWSAPNGPACRAPAGTEPGACWAFIAEKARFIIFGRFPYAEQWRPLLVVAIFVALILASCDRRLWGLKLAGLWVAGLVVVGILMWGGVFGMTYVETALWSGLPLTLILAVVGMAFAFPLAILLALGRRSELPAVRLFSVAYIELVRGVPLITVLFMASVMLPLFLPTGFTIDKLLRAQVAFILFAAAYLAEVIRGGLQAIPTGQIEAADSLGLGYWRRTRLIVLPQALSMVIPPLVNNFIGAFKNTSLVIIIGLFDLLGTANAALADPNWQGFAPEAYIFTAAIYFCFCFFMSRYSLMLEREFSKGRRR